MYLWAKRLIYYPLSSKGFANKVVCLSRWIRLAVLFCFVAEVHFSGNFDWTFFFFFFLHSALMDDKTDRMRELLTLLPHTLNLYRRRFTFYSLGGYCRKRDSNKIVVSQSCQV